MCDLNVMCTWPAGVIAYGSVCKRESIFVRRKENLDKVEVTVGGPREEEGTTVPGLNCHARCRAWWSDPTQTHTETQKTHYTSQIMLLRRTTCIASSGLLLALFLSHTLISTCSYPEAHLDYSSAGVNRQIIGLQANLNHWKIHLAFMRQLS